MLINTRQNINYNDYIVNYTKDEVATKDLIPTQLFIGGGKFGTVHEHRYLPDVVVKKSRCDLTKEFIMGLTLPIRATCRSLKLYIKLDPSITDEENPTGLKVYKLVMEKLPGQTLAQSTISFALAASILVMMKPIAKQVFDASAAWGDLSLDNVMIHDDQVRFCDLGLWKYELNSTDRAFDILWEILLFADRLKTKTKLPDDIESEDFFVGMHLADHKMEFFINTLSKLSDEEKSQYIASYFDFLINLFQSRHFATISNQLKPL